TVSRAKDTIVSARSRAITAWRRSSMILGSGWVIEALTPPRQSTAVGVRAVPPQDERLRLAAQGPGREGTPGVASAPGDANLRRTRLRRSRAPDRGRSPVSVTPDAAALRLGDDDTGELAREEPRADARAHALRPRAIADRGHWGAV